MATPYPTKALVTAADLNNEPDAFPRLSGRGFVVSKAPSWSTSVRRSSSHREVRVANISSPDWVFRLRHEMLRDTAARPDLEEILAFFNSRLGKFGFFYLQDDSDYEVVNQGFGVGNGTEVTFQLKRTLNSGGIRSAIEPIYAPWLTPTIRANGSVIAPSNYTLRTWGRVEFNTPPSNGVILTWSGRFLYVCRFDQDEMETEQLAAQLWSQSGVTIRSIRP